MPLTQTKYTTNARSRQQKMLSLNSRRNIASTTTLLLFVLTRPLSLYPLWSQKQLHNSIKKLNSQPENISALLIFIRNAIHVTRRTRSLSWRTSFVRLVPLTPQPPSIGLVQGQRRDDGHLNSITSDGPRRRMPLWRSLVVPLEWGVNTLLWINDDKQPRSVTDLLARWHLQRLCFKGLVTGIVIR